MRTINPTIATTITITTTFASLKLWLATTSAAAMLRWPVPSAMTRLVSALGPPSNQPVPRPNAINKSPARIPRVPNTCKTLSMFAAVIKHIEQDETDVGNPVEHGLHPFGQVAVTRLEDKAYDKREQHKQQRERAMFHG